MILALLFFWFELWLIRKIFLQFTWIMMILTALDYPFSTVSIWYNKSMHYIFFSTNLIQCWKQNANVNKVVSRSIWLLTFIFIRLLTKQYLRMIWSSTSWNLRKASTHLFTQQKLVFCLFFLHRKKKKETEKNLASGFNMWFMTWNMKSKISIDIGWALYMY